MRSVELDAIAMVAARLESLGVKFAFTGGAVVAFLLDNPRLQFMRQTKDVDAIVEIVTRIQYTDFEARLRDEAGFHHDTSEGAPLCRWVVDGVIVDIMPMRDPAGNFCDRWFDYALQTSEIRNFGNVRIPTVSAACFVATKLLAFKDRGSGDYALSHDLEDVLTVVDGRRSLCEEIAAEREDLREYVAAMFTDFLRDPAFMHALPGHLPPDEASQARLPLLIKSIQNIARLRDV